MVKHRMDVVEFVAIVRALRLHSGRFFDEIDEALD
jgi:hypothetical protein